MVVLSKASVLGAVTLAAHHFTSANTILNPRDEHTLPIDKILAPGLNKGKCDDRAWDSPDNSKAVWDSANGWEFVDRFLDKVSKPAGNTDGWAQTLYNSIFPDAGQSQMSCLTKDAPCGIPEHCDKFEELGNAGAFYILNSLQNFHSYLAQYEENVEWLRQQLSGDVLTIAKKFEFPKEDASKVNVGEALAGAFGIASGFTAPVAGLSGPLSATSGLMSILAPKINAVGEPKIGDTDDAQMVLQGWINGTTNAMRDEVQTIRNAVFGGSGGNEFLEIPKAFKVSGHDVNHPITSVLGDGKWLVQDPTEGLKMTFADAYTHARQVLALNALKAQYHVVMVINEGDRDKDTCNSMKNNVWDDEASPFPYCYGMMWLDGGNYLKGGINDPAFPLWDVFGLDKLQTYRNIFDCWHKNSGNAGNTDTTNMDTRTGLARCAFSMEVKKGSWVNDDGDCYDGATLELDTGFLNFDVASDDYKNKRTRWPHDRPTNSPFCHK